MLGLRTIMLGDTIIDTIILPSGNFNVAIENDHL